VLFFESVGYNQAAYMFSVGFFPLILAKYSEPLFHRSEHITYSLLLLLSCGMLLHNTRLHKMTMLARPKKKKLVSVI